MFNPSVLFPSAREADITLLQYGSLWTGEGVNVTYFTASEVCDPFPIRMDAAKMQTYHDYKDKKIGSVLEILWRRHKMRDTVALKLNQIVVEVWRK